MWLAAIASAVHLLALALGTSSLFLRARYLGQKLDDAGIERVLTADNWWGIASILWIGSGLSRLLWIEKSRDFYFRNGLFFTKMGLFVADALLEMWPMVTFIVWRVAITRKRAPDVSRAAVFRRISQIELAIIVTMVFVAAFMARGAWLF